MDIESLTLLFAAIALVIVIILYATILPKKRHGTFTSPFAQWIHDFFHFKKLYIDSFLRFFFTLLTIFMIVYGIGLFLYALIEFPRAVDGEFILDVLGVAVLGPIVLRLGYELIMMFVLLVQNVLDINKKLDKRPEKPASTPVRPTYPNAAPAQQPARPVYPNAAPAQQPARPVYPNAAPAQQPARPVYPNAAPAQQPVPTQQPAPAPAQQPAPTQQPAPAPVQQPTQAPFKGEEY